jgi:L-seryl-tRNA(Ser) seleniumtransferase
MAVETRADLLRQLPAVNELLNHSCLVSLREKSHGPLLVKAIRAVIAEEREKILQTDFSGPYTADFSLLAGRVEDKLAELKRPSLRRVINATGVILHTNLGRAPLAAEAVANIAALASSYCNLELNLEEGERGERYVHVEQLLCQLSGAQSALVVNNNAAAVLLAINSLAAGRQVIVSRGELVEIGGWFRLPDVMERSGAILVEVGTTNRTYPSDYQRAITSETALLLKVHTSNFKVVGFTNEVRIDELVGLGEKHSLPVMYDLGSGCLIDPERLGAGEEPAVEAALKAGTSLVTISGDKLLGGPQAGIILGVEKYVALAKSNPLNRALRIDKTTLAGLEATLRLYLEADPITAIPTLRLLTMPLEEIEKKSRRLLRLVNKTGRPDIEAEIRDQFSQVGGGALPLRELPTKVVAVRSRLVSAAKLEERLRNHQPPILARVQEDQLFLDTRCLEEKDLPIIAHALLQDSSSSVKTDSR